MSNPFENEGSGDGLKPQSLIEIFKIGLRFDFDWPVVI